MKTFGIVIGLVVIAIIFYFVLKGKPAEADSFDPWVYDRNGDCCIANWEAMEAVHDWQYGPLTKEQADCVVDLWKSGATNPKCGGI